MCKIGECPRSLSQTSILSAILSVYQRPYSKILLSSTETYQGTMTIHSGKRRSTCFPTEFLRISEREEVLFTFGVNACVTSEFLI